MSSNGHKPKIAIFKFASCDGCQLSLLDCEDELLAIAGAIEICYFPEATRNVIKGPYDIALVEGSVTTHHDAQRIQQVRRSAKTLITIGACATSGGVQALRNWQDTSEMVCTVYAKPDFISTLKMSTPIAEHVPVDYELRGCPVQKYHLVELITATLIGRRPNITTYSVCIECKRNGNLCLAVAQGTPCLGPVTQAGCGALCPAFNRGCYGCFGPMESANPAALTDQMLRIGATTDEIQRNFRTYNAWSWQFRQASEEVEKR